MSRRSVSSWDSPGPRVPMPPPVRERCVHRRVRRGSWYSSWASSTWRRPSWVWAWSAKMSRIRRLRSMTLTLSSDSRLFCWAGLSSSSATRMSKPVSRLRLEQLLGLALAHVPVGVHVAAVLPLGAHDVGARGRGQRGELAEAVLGGPAGIVAGVDGDAGTPSRRVVRGRSASRGLMAAQAYRLRPDGPGGRVSRRRADGSQASSAGAGRAAAGRRSRRRPRASAPRGTTSAGAWRTRRCGARRARSPPRACSSPSRYAQLSR